MKAGRELFVAVIRCLEELLMRRPMSVVYRSDSALLALV